MSFETDVDSFLKLLYYVFAEHGIVGPPEIKRVLIPLKEKLRGLVETGEESGGYTNIVFGLRVTRNCQDYLGEIKVGVKLIMEQTKN